VSEQAPLLKRISDHVGWVAAAAAALSALFAYLLYDETVDSSKWQLRPYIYVSPGDIYNVAASGNALAVYARIGNSGHTYARKVERSIAVQIKPRNFTGELTDDERQPGKLILNSGQTSLIYVEAPHLTEEQLESIIDGGNNSLAIFVFGSINYIDADENPHKTDYCFLYYGATATTNRDPAYVGSHAKWCDIHNDAS
jgi:hypothetical protein